jgi:hypothetical protein
VSEKVVSERGTGGATFAAVVMIIGGTFGFFEGLALIVRGTFYVHRIVRQPNSPAGQ